MHFSADIRSTNGVFASRAEVLTVYYCHGAGVLTEFTISMACQVAVTETRRLLNLMQDLLLR
jgi:hypothetical protein